MARRGLAWTYREPGQPETLGCTDHLYLGCPALVRAARGRDPVSVGEVDPLGGDLCGWCVRVWEARYGLRAAGGSSMIRRSSTMSISVR